MPIASLRRAPALRLFLVALLVALGLGSASAALAADQPRAQPVAGTAAPTLSQTSLFVATQPKRVLDTRPLPASAPLGPYPPTATPLEPGETLNVSLDLPRNAVAAAINITVDQDATQKSFITIWPADQPRPTASAINAEPGTVQANTMSVKLSDFHAFSVFNQQGTVNLIIDMVGYYAAVPTDPAAVLPAPVVLSSPVSTSSPSLPALAVFEEGTYELRAAVTATSGSDLVQGGALSCFFSIPSVTVDPVATVPLPPYTSTAAPVTLTLDAIVGLNPPAIHGDQGHIGLACVVHSNGPDAATAAVIEKADLVARLMQPS